ncbi:hypothetical protein E2C01_089749 [Portunus trituberculatus]|uniref:Uncharacterized protein n=1 Tax=Portunus trituberculatus TaxID=210409 RepID=A0A5B7JJ40_PORTR|nr:hypothetical protein [Portunus trituberculatus]
MSGSGGAGRGGAGRAVWRSNERGRPFLPLAGSARRGDKAWAGRGERGVSLRGGAQRRTPAPPHAISARAAAEPKTLFPRGLQLAGICILFTIVFGISLHCLCLASCGRSGGARWAARPGVPGVVGGRLRPAPQPHPGRRAAPPLAGDQDAAPASSVHRKSSGIWRAIQAPLLRLFRSPLCNVFSGRHAGPPPLPESLKRASLRRAGRGGTWG